MATQFTIYRSTDSGAPVLSGTSGSLVNMLTKVLVTGYGSTTGAGWSADYTSSTTSGSSFRPPSGSRFFLSLQDDCRGSLNGTREARIRGFETLTSFDTGSGQFPSTAQGIAGGYIMARKSATGDSTARAWKIFADAYTMYMFITTGDGSIFGTFFGDIYSVKSSTDTYRCLLVGNPLENQSLGTTADAQTSTPTTSQNGHFMPRSFGGGGSSILVGKQGDVGAGSGVLLGAIQLPNGPDNGLYMVPIRIVESATGAVRGRLRGMYHVCHAISAFTDGDIFQGALNSEQAGKTFQIIKTGPQGGMWCIETSNSVEVNT